MYSCDPSPLRLIPLFDGVLCLVAILIKGEIEAGGRVVIFSEVGNLGRLIHRVRRNTGYSNIQRWRYRTHFVLQGVYSDSGDACRLHMPPRYRTSCPPLAMNCWSDALDQKMSLW